MTDADGTVVAACHLTRIAQLACTDPLTELLDRRQLAEQVDLALWNAR